MVPCFKFEQEKKTPWKLNQKFGRFANNTVYLLSFVNKFQLLSKRQIERERERERDRDVSTSNILCNPKKSVYSVDSVNSHSYV